MDTESFNRSADVGASSPQEKRLGEISTMTLAPFGAGVWYLIEDRPRGKKLASRWAPGLAIGCRREVLSHAGLAALRDHEVIKIATTRDYCFVPGDAVPHTLRPASCGRDRRERVGPSLQ